ncbi:DUF6792 domain-containing protein [Amphibacillus cookii]|uniref:DUF6792 domain-containing protein n=1 Tax=Amphibacillus cookii TaxID=767787 RepID=UPI00195A1B11|nr:DUF6792 domain-containing protein [Amphibacillus cookii]MBM7540491.1 hypothetical protein [Amphibacillus cookii]
MTEDLLENEIVKLRIIELEYTYRNAFDTTDKIKLDQAKLDFEADVRRIYLEETRQYLPDHIEIYPSSELIKYNDDLPEDVRQSGYDGTAIYLSDPDNQINQVHIISQGSVGTEDWLDNFFNIFLGIDKKQLESTRIFVDKVNSKVSETSDLSFFALGHSKAFNNNLAVQLIYSIFDNVYGVNGAPVSLSQIIDADRDLELSLFLKFREDIDSIPLEDLRRAIIEYYDNKGVTDNIIHRISEDDPLYGVSGIGNFVLFGFDEAMLIDTHPEVKGLRTIIDQFDEADVRKIQQFLRQYRDDYQLNGPDGFLEAITGIDIEVINQFSEAEGEAGFAVVALKNMDMINTIIQKIPDFLEVLDVILANADIVIDGLLENDYIDQETSEKLRTEIESIKLNAEKIGVNYDHLENLGINQEGIASALMLDIYDNVMESWDSLNVIHEELADALDLIESGHKIEPILNQLADETGVSYSGGDLHYGGSLSSDQEIKWNITSVVRLYQKGLAKLEEMEESIQKYGNQYEGEINEDFDLKNQALQRQIDYMEENPSLFQNDFSLYFANRKHAYGLGKLVKIDVQEEMPTTALPEHELITKELKAQTTVYRNYLTHVREKVEELFEEEYNVSQLFDFQMGG